MLGTVLTALALLASVTAPTEAQKTDDPFYIIAHMANSGPSLDWSVQQGANAVEVDIKFDDNGNPDLFEHGGVCDCSCNMIAPMPQHICGQVLGNKCSGSQANNNARSHLQHVARLPAIALLLIDSKVESKWGTKLITAGTNIVAVLEQSLFGQGYRGKVVISVGDINCYDYLNAAAQAIAHSPNKDRYYFSIDQMGDDYSGVASMLSRFTRNRLFGTGISACAAKTYYSGIRQAVNGVRMGEIGLSYIWTLDKQSSMETYIDLGVQGIITNRVAVLKEAARSKGLRLATVADQIPVSWREVGSQNKCDCDYHKGGCTISYPAPRGQACRCTYKGAWTCGGSLTGCNRDHEKCANPDGSKEACQLGGGDCGGYR